jgi:hypothetical protein
MTSVCNHLQIGVIVNWAIKTIYIVCGDHTNTNVKMDDYTCVCVLNNSLSHTHTHLSLWRLRGMVGRRKIHSSIARVYHNALKGNS